MRKNNFHLITKQDRVGLSVELHQRVVYVVVAGRDYIYTIRVPAPLNRVQLSLMNVQDLHEDLKVFVKNKNGLLFYQEAVDNENAALLTHGKRVTRT